MTQALIGDLGLVLALGLLGAVIARALLGHVSLADSFSFSFPLGAGLLSFALFLLSWAGVKLTLPLVAVVYVALAAIALAMRRLRPLRAAPTSVREEGRARLTPLQISIIALIGLLVLSAVVLAVGQSYAAWDAIAIWSVKGYGIAKEGTILAGEEWGAHGLAYPLNIPILISLFKMIDGDVLPGSKLIFPAFFASLMAGCWRFWRGSGVGRTEASLGVLLLASVPVAYEEAINGYANIPFACYLVLGVLVGIQGRLGSRAGLQMLSGLLLGLACWTRPEGLFVVPFAALGYLLACSRAAKGRPRLGIWLAPLVVLAGAWGAFALTYGTDSPGMWAFRAAFGGIRTGELHLEAVYRILRYALREAVTPGVWGLGLPLLVVTILFGLAASRRAVLRMVLPLVGAATGITIAVLALFYSTSFLGPDLVWWLSTGFNRTMLPAAVLGIVTSVCLIAIPAEARPGLPRTKSVSSNTSQ